MQHPPGPLQSDLPNETRTRQCNSNTTHVFPYHLYEIVREDFYKNVSTVPHRHILFSRPRNVGPLISSAAGKTVSVCGAVTAVLDVPPIARMVGDGGGAPSPFWQLLQRVVEVISRLNLG